MDSFTCIKSKSCNIWATFKTYRHLSLLLEKSIHSSFFHSSLLLFRLQWMIFWWLMCIYNTMHYHPFNYKLTRTWDSVCQSSSITSSTKGYAMPGSFKWVSLTFQKNQFMIKAPVFITVISPRCIAVKWLNTSLQWANLRNDIMHQEIIKVN